MHHGAVAVVRPERAALAAFFPVRPEHEVIYEELVSPGEQVGHRLLARGPLENTRFANFHPRQPASLLAQGVTRVPFVFERGSGNHFRIAQTYGL